MDRDYTHVFFGLVVFAGVIAMLLMVTPNAEQNRIGAAFDTPTDSSVQEFAFSQGDSLEVAGKTFAYAQEGTITIDGVQKDVSYGQVYSLDPRRTFRMDEGRLYVFDKWDADSCEGITGQTRATSPNNVCCDGVSKPLPDCSENDDPLQCGERLIYCEDGVMKSEGAR